MAQGYTKSPPHVGVWIETNIYTHIEVVASSRPPCGGAD